MALALSIHESRTKAVETSLVVLNTAAGSVRCASGAVRLERFSHSTITESARLPLLVALAVWQPEFFAS